MQLDWPPKGRNLIYGEIGDYHGDFYGDYGRHHDCDGDNYGDSCG